MTENQYVYILCNNFNNMTYVGYTNNPERRIRQHNGEICGGARFTTFQKKKCPDLIWRYMCRITADPSVFDKKKALSLEWHIKYETRKHREKGCEGRKRALARALQNDKFAEVIPTIIIEEP